MDSLCPPPPVKVPGNERLVDGDFEAVGGRKGTMKQKTLRTVNQLIDAADLAKGGAEEHGAELELVFGSKVKIETDRDALLAAHNECQLGRTELRKRRAMLHSVTRTGKEFVTLARKTLERVLGNRYTQAWDAAGFRGSLQVPRSPGPIKELIRSLTAFYAQNPTLEIAQLDLTAARAAALTEALNEAVVAVALQEGEVGGLVRTRRARERALAFRMSGLVEELGRAMGPLDARWLAFGLNRPGAKETPEVPTDVEAVIVNDNAMAVAWKRSARAEHYRVWMRIKGVNEEMMVVGSPVDPDFMREGLPPGAEIEVAVSAVNSGGESRRSEPVVVRTLMQT